MSGKAYTMREMKAIVDYLNEKRAYGEIKGRKMWMDFEKSKLTDRTWQSLKETFLKRILPDIHNPYYQLSLTQISSFTQGYDVEAKLKNKLEIRSVNEESNIAKKQLSSEQPSISSHKEDEEKPGEESIKSKTVSHRRSSAETIIVDPCYETAEDIQRDLESPTNDKQTEKDNDIDKSPSKSLRDFITYSEPLTPMLQEVIEEFATDEECEIPETERQSKAVKGIDADQNINRTNGHASDIITKAETNVKSNNAASENMSKNQEVNQLDEISDKNEKTSTGTKQSTQSKIATKPDEIIEIEDSENYEKEEDNELRASKQTEAHLGEESGNVEEEISHCNKEADKEVDNVANNNLEAHDKETINDKEENEKTSQAIGTQNNSNTTIDTLLPNNQEELNIEPELAKSDNLNNTSNKETKSKKLTLKTNINKQPKKRVISQEPTMPKNKRRNLMESSKQVSVSDKDAKINSKLQLKSITKTNLRINPKSKKDKKSTGEKLGKMTEVTEEITDEAFKVTKDKGDEDILCDTNKMVTSEFENPCLKSVCLYDGQYTTKKYSESSDEVPATADESSQEKNDANTNDGGIVVLNSHSESEKKEKPKDNLVRHNVRRTERDKALANVFGFTSGVVTSNRKRRISYQNRASRQQSHTKVSSGSSEWTSETDTEFISSPRGRRNGPARKYLKPKSARILSLEEEGGLFVMYGKKIYPVVKDGRVMKNYVTYSPEHDSEEEEESYWKLKYIEEKKRTAKLTKLLHQNTDDDQQSSERGVSSDFIKPNPPKTPKSIMNRFESTEKLPEQKLAKEILPIDLQKPASTVDKTLRIKMTKQNKELQLEGHWSQIHPVLEQVVQIFRTEIEHGTDVKTPSEPELRKNSNSGVSTPVVALAIDEEAREKVNKLETEIFKEIEEHDKQEKEVIETQPIQESKVAKRRGRPKRSLPPSATNSKTPEKKRKISTESTKLQIEENMGKGQIEEKVEEGRIEENVKILAPIEIENGTEGILRRKTRTLKKVLHENTERNESNVINTRTKKVKETRAAEELIEDDTDVRYKFPSPPPSGKKTYLRSGINKTPKEQKSKNR